AEERLDELQRQERLDDRLLGVAADEVEDRLVGECRGQPAAEHEQLAEAGQGADAERRGLRTGLSGPVQERGRRVDVRGGDTTRRARAVGEGGHSAAGRRAAAAAE